MTVNVEGFIIGIITFILIGIFHPIVIKGEYHFGTKIWPLFLIAGIALCGSSLFVEDFVYSSLLAIAGIIFLWSIKELFEQKERVRKGWYPKKPDTHQNL